MTEHPNYFPHKIIVKNRDEEIPIHVKISNRKHIVRVFKKEHSVFKDWKEDTEDSIITAIEHDFKFWKCSRFVKEHELKEVEELTLKYGKELKNIFI